MHSIFLACFFVACVAKIFTLTMEETITGNSSLSYQGKAVLLALIPKGQWLTGKNLSASPDIISSPFIADSQ
jgi:hypothetical protein